MHSKKLNVELIRQMPELPTGCEITAITMMLRYAGSLVKKTDLAREMPYDDHDCNKGFVGDPFTEHGNSIYPPALMPLVTKYAGNAINLSGQSIQELKNHLANTGHPIVIWVGQFDGFHTHALTMTGFDTDRIFYNDCWTGEQTQLPTKELEVSRAKKMKLAISY
ncbi:hypothetical protein LFYK43_11760 [Ligilactobacillus salitolerans]|uniref:Peptidase C39-like domain-containing protein n=1 Tax=Ligilactobacillus salitolerans TaxID=1808352 RepID=A0A401IT85_9LACO|nr:C39 family peptidase [Ligilactobacillus salitolerans]GBG94717.1 hypothetical protein LFYK43_11760 [Ligilactobacillus salitolerans]